MQPVRTYRFIDPPPRGKLRAAAFATIRGSGFTQYCFAPRAERQPPSQDRTPSYRLKLVDLPPPGIHPTSGRFYVVPYGLLESDPVGIPVGSSVVLSDQGDAYLLAASEIAAEATVQWLARTVPHTNARPLRPGPPVSSASAKTYRTQVAHIREAILRGDLFQANLSREIAVELPGATRADIIAFGEDLLRHLDAPFGAIVQRERDTIISASPERFFRVEGLPDERLRVVAEPIKGTRPRYANPVADEAAARELLASEKDRAENIMIADLVRNDLSLVCEDTSIQVERLCELRSFASVHHLVTTVTGVLRPGLTALDALRAQFPCGSITGAPKLAAMDLIAELEQRERGIYCGAIGYVAADGSADFSVAIRTATVTYHESGATLRYGVGGGVTALSDPEEEYRETEDKAADFLRALRP